MTAFTAYAEYLVGAPAASADSSGALAALAAPAMNVADAAQLRAMAKSPTNRFEASLGAYRILGWSGEEASPQEVMIEVGAPLSVGSNSRWAVIGGVVSWIDGGWSLTSMRPREVAQPTTTKQKSKVSSMTAAERNRVFEGPGWQSFAG